MDIAYNGKSYCGWQRQPNGMSVQESIEHALSNLLGVKIAITGAGRTDTGVHAKQMFAHFNTETEIDKAHLVYRLNAFLPKDIAVNHLFSVPNEAHARFDALEREYEYHLVFNKDPFRYDLAYIVTKQPDVSLMNAGASLLFNYEDFKCFSRSKTDVKTYHCKIMKAQWEWKGETLIFTIRADRFLRNMVRAIVGTLLDVGYGKLSLEELEDIIRGKDRSNAGASAPAHGLYLTKVVYPESIMKN